MRVDKDPAAAKWRKRRLLIANMKSHFPAEIV
jgi:hypothetical protein